MSGTSARESYRSGKRTRPSDSQANRVAPPVLFRLPSVAMPAPDSQVNASNMNSAAMTMPMSSAAVMPASMPSSQTTSAAPTHAPVTQSAAVASAPSTPAQSAAATISAEKASGQRLLNMLIIVLLLAALAVITWISMNRSTSTPSMADKEIGNNAALDTLGELKVPDVTTGALADAPKAQPEANEHGLNLDELKPSNPGDLSLIDLPDSHKDTKVDVTEQSDADSKSLLVGLDTSGIDASQTAPATTKTSTTPTAQIQLRSPVPLGNSGSTSLVDAGRRTEQLGNDSPSSTATPSFDTVSTPSQPVKIFPASTDPAQNSNASPSSSVNKNSQTDGNSGGSPKLWDGAQQTAPEGLQLGSKAPTSNSPTHVSVSQPLSSEFAMPGAKDAGQNVAQNRAEPTATQATGQPAGQALASQTAPGVTVGGGASEPYSMQTDMQPTTGPGSPRTDLHNNRADLDSMMLFRVAASGAAKSAVSGGANVPSPSTAAPINKYATAPNTSASGPNLYQKPNASPTNGQINSYAQANVPPGVTNNRPGGYVPPTTQMPSANVPSANVPGANVPGANNPYAPQMQMASGPNTIPANTVGYAQPRGPQPNYGQPPMNQPSGYPPTGYQNYPQPGAQPPIYAPPAYAPPTNAPAYAQPGYGQPGAQSSYGQPSNGYGPASGSGYPNGPYPSPATQNTMPGMNMNMPSMNTQGVNMPGTNMPGTNMPGVNTQGMNMPAGFQGAASYPTKSPLPGGVVPTGLIGDSGHATAPTGNIAPRPVMGQYGVGMSTPYGTP